MRRIDYRSDDTHARGYDKRGADEGPGGNGAGVGCLLIGLALLLPVALTACAVYLARPSERWRCAIPAIIATGVTVTMFLIAEAVIGWSNDPSDPDFDSSVASTYHAIVVTAIIIGGIAALAAVPLWFKASRLMYEADIAALAREEEEDRRRGEADAVFALARERYDAHMAVYTPLLLAYMHYTLPEEDERRWGEIEAEHDGEEEAFWAAERAHRAALGKQVDPFVPTVMAVRSWSPTCAICGRPLSDPVSMARGIGPSCWAKL